MYPLDVLSTGSAPAPLFGDALHGAPYVFDFSSGNPRTLQYSPTNFPEFQKIVFDELRESGKSWGIGRYLEERRNVLREYPQMISEGRIFHVGLDIIVPEGLPLFAPLPGTVFDVGKEEGVGNYGEYVILKHGSGADTFYSFYGHLNAAHAVHKEQEIPQGHLFAHIGGGNDSGGWFTHVHLQIITETAREQGRLSQGYISKEDLPEVEMLFPSPYALLRY